VIKIPRRKQKIKYSRKQGCKFLSPMGDLSNSLQPLCYCPERDLILGRKAYVCQVCYLYSQISRNIPEIYEESRKIAEKKIKEKKLELDEFELAEVKTEDEIDLTIDEFEEEDEEVPVKFEKRKAGKEDMEGEEFAEVECPFCGELFDNLVSHLRTCEFAPDDASIEDIIPKKRRKKTTSTRKSTRETGQKKETQTCPYCGKEYQRLGRHISACPERPQDEKEDDKEDK
jgi:hypothetical protein